MKNAPFVYAFTSPKYNYIYDFNTNAIIKVNDKIYTALSEKTAYDTWDIDIVKGIEDLVAKGFLKPDHWDKIEHPATKFFPLYLQSSLKSLTLQITQQCNLRCSYCPYSGSYYNREHNNRKMSYEMAQKAVDFYINHSYDIPQLQIGFYGGEPLLEFELMKKVIQYIDKKGFGKKVAYHMTTNATLLTDDVIDYLATKQFSLTISLDGPKEYHDRNRLNVANKGTFDIVLEKVRVIQEKYPEYAEYVVFNCVLDPKNDLKYLNEFFSQNAILQKHTVLFSKIAREGMKDEEAYREDATYRERYSYEEFKLLYSKIYPNDEISPSHIVESYYEQLKREVWERGVSGLTEKASHPGGPCITGCHKLFVDIYGNFYSCEKVSETSEDMKIGSVDEGFLLDKAERLLNIAQLTEEQCKNCWAAKFCYICAQHADSGIGIDRERKLRHCIGVKNNVQEILKDYCLLFEGKGFDTDIMYLNAE